MDAKHIAIRSIELMADGELADFKDLIAEDAINREAVSEPPECRPAGPAAWYQTALWLRRAFNPLHHEIHHVLVQGDLVCADTTMTGRNVGPFVVYTPDGKVDQAFPPTGKTFAVKQSHWLRMADGKIVEHWATRDDQGMARQLGWVPPGPAMLVRMALATRRAKRQL